MDAYQTDNGSCVVLFGCQGLKNILWGFYDIKSNKSSASSTLVSSCMCENLTLLFPHYHSGTRQYACSAWQCTPAQSALMFMGSGAPVRQGYGNQSPSPSWKAEARLSAYRPVLIRRTQGDNSGGLVRAEPGHTVTILDGNTWHWLTGSARTHALSCHAWGSRVAILPRRQSFGSGDDLAKVMWTFLPSAITAEQHLLWVMERPGPDWQDWVVRDPCAAYDQYQHFCPNKRNNKTVSGYQIWRNDNDSPSYMTQTTKLITAIVWHIQKWLQSRASLNSELVYFLAWNDT